MFVSNIPRRKIYERMLDFEDSMLKFQYLNLNEEHFNSFKETFFKENFNVLVESFLDTLAILVLFLENRAFKTEEEFENEFKYYLKNEGETGAILKKSKVISKDFFQAIINLREYCENPDKDFESLEYSREKFAVFDDFNKHIPELLTLRRDEM